MNDATNLAGPSCCRCCSGSTAYLLPLLLYVVLERARALGHRPPQGPRHGRVWGWALAIFAVPLLGAAAYLLAGGSQISRPLKLATVVGGAAAYAVVLLIVRRSAESADESQAPRPVPLRRTWRGAGLLAGSASVRQALSRGSPTAQRQSTSATDQPFDCIGDPSGRTLYCRNTAALVPGCDGARAAHTRRRRSSPATECELTTST
jgi:hypothetical protein